MTTTNKTAMLEADLTEIRRALSLLPQSGDVVELRALDVGGKVHAGYFDDFDKLLEAAVGLSGRAAGVYVVLNRVKRDLLARAANRRRSTLVRRCGDEW